MLNQTIEKTKKRIFFAIILSALLFACESKSNFFEQNKSYDKIIDIRRKSEWENTGIVKNSYTITFNRDDVSQFIQKLNKVVDKDERFAIICRTGTRTRFLQKILEHKGYKVVNIKGGITSDKYKDKLVPYNNKLVPYN